MFLYVFCISYVLVIQFSVAIELFATLCFCKQGVGGRFLSPQHKQQLSVWAYPADSYSFAAVAMAELDKAKVVRILSQVTKTDARVVQDQMMHRFVMFYTHMHPHTC